MSKETQFLHSEMKRLIAECESLGLSYSCIIETGNDSKPYMIDETLNTRMVKS